MADSPRTYLVHIKLKGGPNLRARIQETAPFIQTQLKSLAVGDIQLAHTSDDGGTFGFFLNTNSSARTIRLRLESPDHPLAQTAKGSALKSDDSTLVLELGTDYDGQGFSRGWTWLQHHGSKG